MREINEIHRTPVVHRVTKDRVRALDRGIVRKIRDGVPQQLSTSGNPTLHPQRIWGGV